jgi:hypothetical protein
MGQGVRIIKVTGAPRVSYWELRNTNGNFLGVSPANTLGILTFETSFSGAARLFPVTLRGSGYREGISVSAATGGGPSGGSYSVIPPAALFGYFDSTSDPFTVTSSGITTPTLVTLSSSLAGVFDPVDITLPIGSETQSFTYMPTVDGSHVLSFSSVLANPNPITYVATNPFG